MARAKAKGVGMGRPRLGIDFRQKIAKRSAEGDTPYAIAKALGIDRHKGHTGCWKRDLWELSPAPVEPAGKCAYWWPECSPDF